MIEYIDKLSDSEKFVIIMQKYTDVYGTQKNLAEEMDIPQQSISDWKKNTRTIHIKNRNKICKLFRLKDSVWIDPFYDTVNFEEMLNQYKIIEHESIEKELVEEVDVIAQNIMHPVNEISEKEQALLEQWFHLKSISLDDYVIEEFSSVSLFELSKLLKSKNQIVESLELLSVIEQNEGSFKYRYHYQIEHLKAILFSHDSLRAWDKSIDILRLLYVGHYHMKEPEIITLLASNYKRKALYNMYGKEKWLKRENINMDLLSSAMILYREAYEGKKGEVRYYDAINFAYLYRIVESLEMENSNILELQEMYQQISSEWQIDNSHWWEVSSNAEFLMLINQTDLAILKITEFLEKYVVEKFDIETTLRQLEMYLHFTNDINAERLYLYLVESWNAIKQTF